MFAMRCDPIEMFGPVVHRVKSPKNVVPVTRAMERVDHEITRDDGDDDLQRRRKRTEQGRGRTHDAFDRREHGNRNRVDEKILAEEKADIDEERGPYDRLRARREYPL